MAMAGGVLQPSLRPDLVAATADFSTADLQPSSIPLRGASRYPSRARRDSPSPSLDRQLVLHAGRRVSSSHTQDLVVPRRQKDRRRPEVAAADHSSHHIFGRRPFIDDHQFVCDALSALKLECELAGIHDWSAAAVTRCGANDNVAVRARYPERSMGVAASQPEKNTAVAARAKAIPPSRTQRSAVVGAPADSGTGPGLWPMNGRTLAFFTFPHAAPGKSPGCDQEDHSRSKKGKVPPQGLRDIVADVMKPKDVMVDDAFD